MEPNERICEEQTPCAAVMKDGDRREGKRKSNSYDDGGTSCDTNSNSSDEITLVSQGKKKVRTSPTLGRETEAVQGSSMPKEENTLLILDRFRQKLGLPELNYMVKQVTTAERSDNFTTPERRTISKCPVRWSKEEEDVLINAYNEGRSVSQTLELLPNRTHFAVEKRRQNLLLQGILDPSLAQQSWTEDETSLIKSCINAHWTADQIVQSGVLSGRSHYAIKDKVEKIKEKSLQKAARSRIGAPIGHWTEVEDNIISMGIDNNLSISSLLESLEGRTYGTVKQRRQFLMQRKGMDSTVKERRFWTEEEDQIVARLVREKASTNTMQEHLPGRSRAAIAMRKRRFVELFSHQSSSREAGNSRMGTGRLLAGVLTPQTGQAERRRYNWRSEEDEVIIKYGNQRDAFPRMMSLLPGRTRAAISSRRYSLRSKNLLNERETTPVNTDSKRDDAHSIFDAKNVWKEINHLLRVAKDSNTESERNIGESQHGTEGRSKEFHTLKVSNDTIEFLMTLSRTREQRKQRFEERFRPI